MTQKTLKLGFALLAHENIFRVRQIVTYLAKKGFPIAIHLDAKTPLHKRKMLEHFFKEFKQVYWVESISCEWGQWSIVDAQIRTVRALMNAEPELDYIYNLSGSCLPIRPPEELQEFLAESDVHYDYIESVSLGEDQWVYDGLNKERVEFYHPFNWKSQRRLFDLNVKIQRRFKFRRKIPEGLDPSFGSQWWCLTAKTLQRIFDDPNFENYCKFFSKSWIPDESFFQTLARKHSSRIESKTLTYITFDNMGKPFLVYDDQIDILERLDAFFVRKVWRGADALYTHFLNPVRKPLKRDPFAELELQALQDHAHFAMVNGRNGLYSQFRSPRSKTHLETRAQYYVYVGFHSVRAQIYEHYYGSPTIAQMGYLYHPNRTETELTQHRTPKNTRDLYYFRDYQKLQFLAQRVWTSFPRKLAFLARPHHLRKMMPSMMRDPNCALIVVKGAWLLDLFSRQIENIERLRTICRIETRRESRFLEATRANPKARVSVVDLSDLLFDAETVSQNFPEQLELSNPNIDLSEFRKFVKFLMNNGVSLKDYDTIRILDENAARSSAAESTILSFQDYLKTKNG